MYGRVREERQLVRLLQCDTTNTKNKIKPTRIHLLYTLNNGTPHIISLKPVLQITYRYIKVHTYIRYIRLEVSFNKLPQSEAA